MPLIVGIRPIRIEPLLAVRVPLDREDVRIAVGIGLCATPSVPPPFEYSLGCILFAIRNRRVRRTKYLHF
jgi:hypothetical protein